jgi:hypothetical protein
METRFDQGCSKKLMNVFTTTIPSGQKFWERFERGKMTHAQLTDEMLAWANSLPIEELENIFRTIYIVRDTSDIIQWCMKNPTKYKVLSEYFVCKIPDEEGVTYKLSTHLPFFGTCIGKAVHQPGFDLRIYELTNTNNLHCVGFSWLSEPDSLQCFIVGFNEDIVNEAKERLRKESL